MEQYKLINAELMDQVQKQRIIIGEMQKTEVLLKKQLLEEREIRLADAQYHKHKLKCAIQTLLNSLDLNLDGQIDAMTENVRQTVYSSGQVCSEVRRSSALLQRNLMVSPIRRTRSRSQSTSSAISCNSSRDEGIENPKETSPIVENVTTVRKTPEPRHLAELEEYMSSPDTPQAAVTTTDLLNPLPVSTPPTPANAYMSSIIEESDSEDNTLSSHETKTLLVTSSSSMEISALPLRDLTNKITRPQSSQKFGKAQKHDTETMQESSIEEVRCALQQSSLGPLTVTHPSPKITKMRGQSSRVSKNETDAGRLEPSIEHVRLAVRESSPMQLMKPCASMNLEPTLTPRRSQLDFSSFNGIAGRPGDSSTPRSDQETLKPKFTRASTKSKPKRTKSTAHSLTGAEQSSRESVVSRPKRSCQPKSLKEPSCISKLRNESSIKK